MMILVLKKKGNRILQNGSKEVYTKDKGKEEGDEDCTVITYPKRENHHRTFSESDGSGKK